MAHLKRTKKMALTALFTALMIIGGFIRIPAPFAPITLQAQIALLSGVLLGGLWGSLAVLLYAFLGLIGLPIFAGGGGFAYVLQPTFGYVLGFVLAALVTGKIARGGVISFGRIAVALAVGVVITYVVGLAYAALILMVYLKQTVVLTEFLVGYALITLPKDIVLVAVMLPLAKRLIVYI